MSDVVPVEGAAVRRVPRQALLVLPWFPIGLGLDALGGTTGLLLTTLVTWALLFWVWRAQDRAGRRALIACVLWSTAGEIALTELFGLYHYRLGFVPPFVPPGHALLFQCGAWITAWLTPRLRIASRVLAFPVALCAFGFLGDQQSLCYLAIFALLLRVGSNPALYGTMYFLALSLELVGTAIGTWRWSAADPHLGLSTINPPVAAGVFYCVLDALVLSAQRFSRGVD